jgi:hypothetical protein
MRTRVKQGGFRRSLMTLRISRNGLPLTGNLFDIDTERITKPNSMSRKTNEINRFGRDSRVLAACTRGSAPDMQIKQTNAVYQHGRTSRQIW